MAFLLLCATRLHHSNMPVLKELVALVTKCFVCPIQDTGYNPIEPFMVYDLGIYQALSHYVLLRGLYDLVGRVSSWPIWSFSIVASRLWNTVLKGAHLAISLGLLLKAQKQFFF